MMAKCLPMRWMSPDMMDAPDAMMEMMANDATRCDGRYEPGYDGKYAMPNMMKQWRRDAQT